MKKTVARDAAQADRRAGGPSGRGRPLPYNTTGRFLRERFGGPVFRVVETRRLEEMRLSKESQPPITFGLVRPSEPGNVGAAARGLAAFGFGRLVLIDPPPRQASRDRALAVRMGRPVLDGARTVTLEQVPELLDGFDEVWGTSARQGRRRIHAEASEVMASYLDGEPGRLLILFGSERDGLSLEWLDRCHHLIRLPTPGGPLNLAQAVTVVAYELRSQIEKARGDLPAEPSAQEPQATLSTRREILERVGRLLAEIDYPTRHLRSHPYEAHLEPLRSGSLSRKQARWFLGLLGRLQKRLARTSHQVTPRPGPA